MPLAGYVAQIKLSGAAVAMTAEPCGLVGGNVFQITDASRRIVDPATAVVVKENGAPTTLAPTIDYLFGVITFPSAPTAPITIDGAFIPTYSVAECRGIAIGVSADLGDVSVFETSAKKKLALLHDVSGSIDRLLLPLDDIDTVTGGTQSLDAWMIAGEWRVLDVLFAAGVRLRAFVIFGSYDVNASVEGLVEVSVAYEGAAQKGVTSISFGA